MPKATDGYVLMPLSHTEALALEREGEWLRLRYRQDEGPVVDDIDKWARELTAKIVDASNVGDAWDIAEQALLRERKRGWVKGLREAVVAPLESQASNVQATMYGRNFRLGFELAEAMRRSWCQQRAAELEKEIGDG